MEGRACQRKSVLYRFSCPAPRSSFFSLFSTCFLQPPVPLTQTSDGVKAALVGDTTASFTSVFLTQSLNRAVLPSSLSAYRYLPYSAYCPSVQSVLLRRTCKKCSLYHALISSLKAHTRRCGVQHPWCIQSALQSASEGVNSSYCT